MHSTSGYAVIILAAGNSSRLGEPKQLLQYQNKTLIRHVTEAAIASDSDSVIVITGSNASLIREALSELACHTVENPDWQSGMASSIVRGIQELMTFHPDSSGAIIAVSDQPFVSDLLFNTLINHALESEFGIIASSYDDTLGTPVLFTKKYFPSLLALHGPEGARKLLKQFAGDICAIPFPSGNIDIDTQDDYRKLLDNN